MVKEKIQLAPIVLFVYKRIDTLKATILSLQKNYLASESDLIIFSDSWKTEKDKVEVEVVRKYIASINGFRSVTIKLNKINTGLANSIINGVSEVLSVHGKVIVLEDDLVSSTNYLNFMNQALENFKEEKQVFSISGYSFDLTIPNDYVKDSYFLNRGWSWGWATWRDRWLNVDWSVSNYDNFKKNSFLRNQFSKGGSDLNAMLDKQMTGKLDSWAIRWFFYQFCIKGFTVFPVQSKIYNIGFGQDATHTKGSNKRYIPSFDTSEKVDFEFERFEEMNGYFQKKFQEKMSLLERIKSRLDTILMKLR